MTNMQQFVFDYLEKSRRDPMIDSCVYLRLEQISVAVKNYHNSTVHSDLDHVSEVRNRISDYSLHRLKRLEEILGSSDRSSETRDTIETLRSESQRNVLVLMTAHQPNLFAYSGVLKKIALLSSLSKSINNNSDSQTKIVCFFGVADHDFVSNKWVRSAEIPSPTRKDGVLRFNVKLDKKQFFLPSNKIPKPPKSTLDSWKDQTISWIKENAALARKQLPIFSGSEHSASIESIALNGFSDYWQIVESVWAKTDTLAEFSSQTLAAISQQMFSTPLVFANFSDCFRLFGDEYEQLVSSYASYTKVVEDNESALKSQGVDSGLSEEQGFASPLWMKCDCGSKRKLIFGESSVIGKCLGCQDEKLFSVEELKSQVDRDPGLFEPRSISMPIIFSHGFGMDCYVGGIGGLGYLLHSRAASAALNIPFPPTPYWYSPDSSLTIESLAAVTSLDRISKEYKLEDRVRASDVEAIREKAKKFGEVLEDKRGTGQLSRSPVLERDVQMLQRMAIYDNSYPNSIEIAINFGLVSAGDQWENHLETDGHLQVPVQLKPKWLQEPEN